MKIAFFYHCRMAGGRNVDTGASINPLFAQQVFNRQTKMIVESGLYAAIQELHVGMSGNPIGPNLSFGKCHAWIHGAESKSLLPTLCKLQAWLPGDERWLIGFAHMKGVTHPNNPMIQRWADCLNFHTITNWKRNVADLESGRYDACGCHWTRNSPDDPNADRWGSNPYFAGGFWWATADYLLTLPKFPTDKPRDRHDWYLPELWLGNGNPRVRDYHPGDIRFGGHP